MVCIFLASFLGEGLQEIYLTKPIGFPKSATVIASDNNRRRRLTDELNTFSVSASRTFSFFDIVDDGSNSGTGLKFDYISWTSDVGVTTEILPPHEIELLLQTDTVYFDQTIVRAQ